MKAGDDAQNWYVQAGYLWSHEIGPGRIRPYGRYEATEVRDSTTTNFFTIGSDYYLKDRDAKLSVDYTFVDTGGRTRGQSIVTCQIAVGF